MKFPVLWSSLVSRVGASHRVNLVAPFPLRWSCPRKIDIGLTSLHLSPLDGLQCPRKIDYEIIITGELTCMLSLNFILVQILFSLVSISLPYSKTKENKTWIKDKNETQQISLHVVLFRT